MNFLVLETHFHRERDYTEEGLALLEEHGSVDLIHQADGQAEQALKEFLELLPILAVHLEFVGLSIQSTHRLRPADLPQERVAPKLARAILRNRQSDSSHRDFCNISRSHTMRTVRYAAAERARYQACGAVETLLADTLKDAIEVIEKLLNTGFVFVSRFFETAQRKRLDMIDIQISGKANLV